MDVIVTGATGGIGSSLVRQAVESPEIEKVYCRYRNQEKFDSFFGTDHPKIITEKYDASCHKEDSGILKVLQKEPPRSIACVYTAFSISPIKRVGTYTADEIKENISINVLNLVLFTNQLVQLKQKYKTQLRLINIDSGAAYNPLNGWGLYSGAKAYANMYLRTVQLENPDIKIVSYEPGVVDTPMQEEIRRTDKAVFDRVNQFKEYYNNKMLRSPDKIAEDIIKRFILSWEGTEFKEGYEIK